MKNQHPGIVFYADLDTSEYGHVEFDSDVTTVYFEARLRWPADPKRRTKGCYEDAFAVLQKCEIDDYADDFVDVFGMLKMTKRQFADYCEANGFPLPYFWFGNQERRGTLAKDRTACRKWLEQQVRRPKDGAKGAYWKKAKRQFGSLSRNAFNEVWKELAPENWKQSDAPPGQQ